MPFFTQVFSTPQTELKRCLVRCAQIYINNATNDNGKNRAQCYKEKILEKTYETDYDLAKAVLNDIKTLSVNLGTSKIFRGMLLQTLLNFFQVSENDVWLKREDILRGMIRYANAAAGSMHLTINISKQEVEVMLLERKIKKINPKNIELKEMPNFKM